MTNTNHVDTDFPHNPTTQANYAGNNVPELMEAADQAGWESLAFAGYGQWQAAGRQVRKGEKSTAILRPFPLFDKKTKKPIVNDDGTQKMGLSGARVFNIAQTDEMTDEQIAKAKEIAAKRAEGKGKKKGKAKRKAPRKSKAK